MRYAKLCIAATLWLTLFSCASSDSVDSEVAFNHLDKVTESFHSFSTVTPHERAGFEAAVAKFLPYRSYKEGARIPYSPELLEAATLIEQLHGSVMSVQSPAVSAAIASRKRWLASNFRRMFEAAGPEKPPVD